MHDAETEIEAAVRVGPVKLGVDVEVGAKIGGQTCERDGVVFHLSDYAATICGGRAPQVPQRDTTLTQYVDLTFTSNPAELFDAARKGSACAQIYLEYLGIDWRPHKQAGAPQRPPREVRPKWS
ncbi:hypothetical protein MBOT_40670 [Mycobacterium botniense]|uniref:Uncharacterized protein n=2 Tax=Mycobacterium botniense TaxID=84962 RepID=A0A7I9Y3Q1_9MYCO|nr:hypothetical protein MBOT_40670 [Mycobacterium botniense]